MIGYSKFREDRREKRCVTCNGLMLAATIANAKWLAENRGGWPLACWWSILNGMRIKKYCCFNCGGPTATDGHDRLCTLKSENPREESGAWEENPPCNLGKRLA